MDKTNINELNDLLSGKFIKHFKHPEMENLKKAFKAFNRGNINEAYHLAVESDKASPHPYLCILKAYFAAKSGKFDNAILFLENSKLQYPTFDISKLFLNNLKLFSREQNTKIGIHVHALHKTASMFLYGFFKYICNFTDIHLYSINNDPPNHENLTSKVNESFCSCPERYFLWRNNFENSEHTSKEYHIYQVRDPRDIIVSQYYHMGWTHSDKNWNTLAHKEREHIRSIGIDKYALLRSCKPALNNTPCLLDRYQPILSYIDKPNVIVIKYEDMVLDFEKWLEPIVSVMQFKNKPQVSRHLFNIFRDQLIIPEVEQLRHKRKVAPGDHIEKLQAKTIKNLNNIFSDILDCFDYS